MKKIAYILIVIIGIVIFTGYAEGSNQCKEIEIDYCINKIDSIKNWYIIYAIRNDTIFKIVSMKSQEKGCTKISIGNKYNLILVKRLENVLSPYGLKLLPMNYLDIKGSKFDENNDVFVEYEKGVIGLYTCDALKGLCLAEQYDCGNDGILYLAAYNYILNDSINHNEKIAVCDSIIDLDRFWFSQDMKDFPIEKENIDKYRAAKEFKWDKPYYSYYIDSLFCEKNKQANNILFFSQIEDNMLRTDILPHKRCVDKFNYNAMAFQNIGLVYLFIFDKNNTIKIVLSREIIYD